MNQRTTAEIQRLLAATWRAQVEQPLGEWTLRAAAGFTRRANSALATGDPGRDLPAAEAAIVAFAEHHGIPPQIQTVRDSDWDRLLRDAGWTAASPTVVLTNPLDRLRRQLPDPGSPAIFASTPTDAWLAAFPREREAGLVARNVLLSGQPIFGRIDQTAWIRGSIADDSLSITNLLVAPHARRRGLARTILAALVGWATEREATTALLAVEADNAAALALYAHLGFSAHHSYHYLSRASQPSARR